MPRVLDLDLDFFVHGVAHWLSSDGPRLSDAEYPAWSPDDAVGFIEERCGLGGPLPGWVVEHHGEIFPLWREAVENGWLQAPFHVTHVDAHADVGLGDSGYRHLITEVMHRRVEDRSAADVMGSAVGDGNWLAFAIACRWVSDVTYVYNEGGGSDLFSLYVSDDDTGLALPVMSTRELDRVMGTRELPDGVRRDPVVPFTEVPWRAFGATEPYDFIVLCRSPGFTPSAADTVFDLLRERYVDQAAFE